MKKWGWRWIIERTLTAVFVMLLSACASDTSDDDDDGGSSAACPAVGDLEVREEPGFAGPDRCEIGGVLTQSATLRAGPNWVIDESITVGSGGSTPTLTIQTGAEIKGDGEDYIYVSPGSSLRAVGTPANPIIFSSFDGDYNLNTADVSGDAWAGLILEDNTGSESASRLEYVIVAEAGEQVSVGGNTYDAGISLRGEHENTVLKNVQVHDTMADGIALYSGADNNIARLETILVTGADRDGIRYQQFRGLLKDILIIHRPGSSLEGRAGIRAEGMDSLPLIVNTTLFGAGTDGGAGTEEVGISFEQDATQVRMANVAIINFSDACYSVASGVNLSTVTIGIPPPPDDNFVDGVHCANEFSDAMIQVGSGTGITGRGSGNDAGLRFYNSVNVAFEGEESDFSGGFTEAWYLKSIAGIDNGMPFNINSPPDPLPGLFLYNGGDTDNDGVFANDTDDQDFSPFLDGDIMDNPLFSGINVLGGIQFFCGDAVAHLPPGAEFVNPSTEIPLSPQPIGFVCGFIKISTEPRGFNLTVIGAIRDSAGGADTQFDGWTLQSGALSTDISGFLP